jgi:hypothetical protein
MVFVFVAICGDAGRSRRQGRRWLLLGDSPEHVSLPASCSFVARREQTQLRGDPCKTKYDPAAM